ncbi:isoleucine--tRNA ligase [Candidatus Pacearchaeota archaeon]|nr:isoleucine--tRNA ligase [Candidatus Pacearchaeota archaeon]
MVDVNGKEKEILEFWEKDKTFEKSLKGKKKSYVFYDGPPFATGLPHYGHILGSTVKDTIPRFWTMKGYKVDRVWGWDCHGLPIENIVEKDLGIETKKQIEEMGVDKFCSACHNSVSTYVKEWGKTVKRMGRWVDFEGSYKTLDLSYMESVWWAFKELWKKKLVYEGKRVLLYCPRCETPLSNAEIAMDNSYKTITETSVTVKFALKGERDTYMLAWTTTPWTLPGNSALYVKKDFVYVKVKSQGEYYILAKERLDAVMQGDYEVVEELTAKDLVGKEYEPLFDYFKDFDESYHKIDYADFVTLDAGTGLVHSALMYGPEDYERGKEQGLKDNHTVDLSGKMKSEVKVAKGLFFKSADKVILEDLDARGLVYSTEKTTHPYPHCYRCESPLLYYAIDSWFVRIQKIRDKILKNNQKMSWYPSHLKDGRVKNNISEAPDWNISRNRYWATPIPVWKCQSCDRQEIVGSVAELKKLSGKTVRDLHKHVVDGVEIPCSCGGKMKRIPEVLDCWVESASMPFAQVHYPFEKKSWFDQNFPGDFVAEYIAQTRTWFYYSMAMASMLFDKPPFKHVVTTGNMLAEDGNKMSKSKGNYPDPHEVIEKYGADALRFYLMRSSVMSGEDVRFSERSVDEVYKKVLLLWYNVGQFYVSSGCHGGGKAFTPKHVLDRWMLSRLEGLLEGVTDALEKYDTVRASKQIMGYIEDLSTWYVRRSRDRFGGAERKEAEAALGYILGESCKILAPLLPFATEAVWREVLGNKGSVHLESWPKLKPRLRDQKLEEEMASAREVVSVALKEREMKGLGIRQPLASLSVVGAKLGAEVSEVVKDEVNVKSVSCKAGKELAVSLDTRLTPELEAEGLAREVARAIQGERKKAGLEKGQFVEMEISVDGKAREQLEPWLSWVQERVHAKSLVVDGKSSGSGVVVLPVKGNKIGLKICHS